MLIDCRCGQTNRIPGASAKKFRCGKCRHPFTPQELVHARIEPPPSHTFTLTEPTHACNEDDDCGWEGTADELEKGKCPDCGSKVHPLA